MAVMDTRIPFMVQTPDFANVLAQSSAAADVTNQVQRNNALASLYQAQGADILAGQQPALNALAQIDPMAALGVQDQRQGMDARALQMDATRQDMRMQAEQWAAALDDRQRQEAAAATQQAIAVLMSADTPEAWDALAQQYGKPEMAGQFARREQILAENMTLAEVLQRQEARTAPPEVPEPPASFRALELRAREAGLIPGSPEYRSFMAQGDAPSTVINNNIPNPNQSGVTDGFYESLDATQADMFGALLNQGVSAPARLAQIDELDRLLQASPSGLAGAAVQFLGNLGIPTEGMDTVQAATAIVNRLVPAQRPPGSGPMSDRDVQLFIESLPRIINSPGGNELITSTMRGLVVYEQQQAEIANRVASREITPAQGRAELMALDNPLLVTRTDRGDVAIQGSNWSDMSVEDLVTVDITTLSREELRAYVARMAEINRPGQ